MDRRTFNTALMSAAVATFGRRLRFDGGRRRHRVLLRRWRSSDLVGCRCRCRDPDAAGSGDASLQHPVRVAASLPQVRVRIHQPTPHPAMPRTRAPCIACAPFEWTMAARSRFTASQRRCRSDPFTTASMVAAISRSPATTTEQPHRPPHQRRWDGCAQIPQEAKLDFGIFTHQILAMPGNRAVIMVTRGNRTEANKAEDPAPSRSTTSKMGSCPACQSAGRGNGGLAYGPRHRRRSRAHLRCASEGRPCPLTVCSSLPAYAWLRD